MPSSLPEQLLKLSLHADACLALAELEADASGETLLKGGGYHACSMKDSAYGQTQSKT